MLLFCELGLICEMAMIDDSCSSARLASQMLLFCRSWCGLSSEMAMIDGGCSYAWLLCDKLMCCGCWLYHMCVVVVGSITCVLWLLALSHVLRLFHVHYGCHKCECDKFLSFG